MKKRCLSGTLVVARGPIGCRREDAPAGATDHTSQRKRKKGGQKAARSSTDFTRVMALTGHPESAHGFPSARARRREKREN